MPVVFKFTNLAIELSSEFIEFTFVYSNDNKETIFRVGFTFASR